MSDYLDPNNEELLRDFFEEAQLQVDLMEQNILVLENDSEDRDSVDELFRAAHTLKGAAATVQMDELTKFTHLVEDVLDEVRGNSIKVSESVVDVILTTIDIIKLMLGARIEGSIYDDNNEITSATDRLGKLLSGDFETLSQVGGGAQSSIGSDQSGKDDFITEYEIYELFENAGKGNPVYRVRVDFDEDALMNTVGGVQVYSLLKNVGIILKTTPDFEALNEDVFRPSVFYYLTTDLSIEDIVSKVSITDVTIGNDVIEITEDMIESLTSFSESDGQDTLYKQDSPEEKIFEIDDSSMEGELLNSLASEAVEKKENKKEVLVPNSKKVKKPLHQKEMSSILRVDSRKIDNLLNMVSESVINKSAINKVSIDLAELQSEYQNVSNGVESQVSSLIDSIPEMVMALSKEGSVKDSVDAYREKYSQIFDPYSKFESKLKKALVDLKNASQKLSTNTGNLQEGIMKIRMVPISSIFSRFPRLVRDLSHSLNKDIDLVLDGGDTELDKSVIEDLLDPLIHCVRNSIDHGIELPAERVKAGKSKQGTIRLKASNEGSMILIEIFDDGKGIDPDFILNKAVEKGFIDDKSDLDGSNIYDLLFQPGFSTADKISNVSGRGVGMDVVRTQIEKLKGSINISSEIGKGTRLSIRLPLTLAIIQGLLVRVGTEIYSIPVSSVVDSHRIKNDDIKFVDSYEVFNLRNEVIFLSRLSELFRISTDGGGEYKYVVVVGTAEKKVGLIVDQLIGEEDVVIKPLKDNFSHTPGIAGATILGDGKVSLIIDVNQLLELRAFKQIEIEKSGELLIK